MNVLLAKQKGRNMRPFCFTAEYFSAALHAVQYVWKSGGQWYV